MKGGHSGSTMLDKIKEKIPVWKNECDATVVCQEEPFAVAIVTPLMKRAHASHYAHDVCFVDSTASCDADNHVLTFLLTATAAGAVPLGVIITDSTSAASYTAGFNLFKSVLPDESFGGHGHPSVFITDDCDAERTALQTCWPAADLKLCLFHVPQAVWRWLWAESHRVAKDDRKTLMTEFRRIVYCADECEANIAFDEAINSETVVEYENYQEYLHHWWNRRQLWCLAWRSSQHRGHHTNNFAEVTVRLYKDIVLCRAKAYNAVSLVDFTVKVMENYYRHRLRDFANGRISAQHLFMDRLRAKSSYLVSCDQITDYNDGKYGVPNSDGTELYIVDLCLGCCTCRHGMTGKFCKHQSAVMHLFNAAFPNAPGVTAEDRHKIAYIALGDKCPAAEFYRNLRTGQGHNAITQERPDNVAELASNALMSSGDIQERESVERPSMDTLLQEYHQPLCVNCARFSVDEPCHTALQKSSV